MRPRAVRLRPYGLVKLAEALSQLGKQEEALATIDEALDVQERTGQRRWEPELYRVHGVAFIHLNQLEAAQHALEEAVRIARRQQSKAYELRAATSLARLWGEQGRRTEARDLLAPICCWFTEGFDTADLKKGRKLTC